MNYQKSLLFIIAIVGNLLTAGQNPHSPNSLHPGQKQRSISFLRQGATLSEVKSDRPRAFSGKDDTDRRSTEIKESLSHEQEELTQLSQNINKNSFDIENLTKELNTLMNTIKKQNRKFDYVRSALVHLLRKAHFDDEKDILINQYYLKIMELENKSAYTLLSNDPHNEESYFDHYLKALDAMTIQELQEALGHEIILG